MKSKLLCLISVLFLIAGCSDSGNALSVEEIQRNYATKIIFLDTIIDIPTLNKTDKIKEVTIECRVDGNVINRTNTRYSASGLLLGAENMKLINNKEILSTLGQDPTGRWYKRLFNNSALVSSQAFMVDEKGYIIAVEDNQEQKYDYNEQGQLVHSLEFHPLEGVLLTNYEYDPTLGLLRNLKREIYPFGGGSKVASITISYEYDEKGNIAKTKNTSELLAMNLYIEWDENFDKSNEFGHWQFLPLGQMKSYLLSTGEETTKLRGQADCKRDIIYY